MKTILAVLAALYLFGAHSPALGRDSGQWEASDQDVRNWYRGLMRPDSPMLSCCGEADAYWADSFERDGENYVAIITDDRDDGPLGRPHIDTGTRVTVPNQKLKWDAGNPTGHGIIFISPYFGVLCYVAPGGV